MGVDGIGPKGPAVPPIPAHEPGGADAIGGPEGAAGPTSAAPETHIAEASAAERAEATAALGQLERGEIDLEKYLDAQIVRAVSHLEPHLDAAQLDEVRETLRGQLASDPVLQMLAERAGKVATGTAYKR